MDTVHASVFGGFRYVRTFFYVNATSDSEVGILSVVNVHVHGLARETRTQVGFLGPVHRYKAVGVMFKGTRLQELVAFAGATLDRLGVSLIVRTTTKTTQAQTGW